MFIKNLFDAESYHEIVNRINNLTPESQQCWGKMTVSQMLAHCSKGFTSLFREKATKRSLIGRLIGWSVKSKMYNETSWTKNLPTSPYFIVNDDRDFNNEKKELETLNAKFYQTGRLGIGDKVHPFFGKLTAEQWGKMMWKHLDHHLNQFGV